MKLTCDLCAGLVMINVKCEMINDLPPVKRPLDVHPSSSSAFPWTVRVAALIRGNHDTNCNTYRCFLPDLTGFVSVCCAVSNQQQAQTGPGLTVTLCREFNPA